jgi:manganese/iron transport system permease protein
VAEWTGAAVDWLAGPWQAAFMLPKFAAVAILAPVCGVVGPFLMLRRMAFFGDALAHAILPGVAIGYYAGGPSAGAMFGGALVAALVAALGISAIRRRADVGEDSAIGIVFAAMFALGIALISRRGVRIDLSHILIGQLLAVGWADVLRMAVVGGGVLAVIALLYKELVIASFDSVLATTLRLPTAKLDALLLVLLALTIVVGLQAVGVVLMVAFLITPAATAYLVTDRLPSMILVSVGVAALSGLVGLYLTYYASIAASAAIVLPCTVCFGAAFVWTGVVERGRGGAPGPSV